jgi:hypothetical protein
MWECDQYKVKVWNKDSSRLAFRRSTDMGIRDAGNGFTGIGVRVRISSNVADRAKTEMAAKTAKKAHKSSLSAAGQVVASEKGDLRTERTQDTLPHTEIGVIAAGNAQTLSVIKRTSASDLATPVGSKGTKRNTRAHGREHRS